MKNTFLIDRFGCVCIFFVISDAAGGATRGDRRATRGDDDGSIEVSASVDRDGVHGCARGAFG